MSQDPDDPSTWTWTDNGVLVLMDYLWHEDGMRLPRSLIELGIDVWKDEADYADEACDLKAGGTEKRYRLAGGYNLTDPPKAVLPLMLEPMDAQLRMRGDGAIIVETGKYTAPTVTLSDDCILSYSGLQRGKPKTDLRNEIHAKFISPDYKYIEQEADPWVNQDSVDVDGTQAMSLDNMDWCPSHRQARVRMKIEAYRQCPDWSGSIVTNAWGMNAFDQRLITVSIAELGINGTFEIEKWEFDPKSGNCTFSIHSMPSEAWAWDPDVDEGTAPGVGTDPTVTPVADPPTAPTGLSVTDDAGTETVSFTAPNDLRVAACRVWRGTTTTFADATDISDALYCSPNQVLNYEDTPGTGTWYYWVTAENLAGDLSDETGPETVTI